MIGERLWELLEKIKAVGETVGSAPGESIDDLWYEWTTANVEAGLALDRWRGLPSRTAYAAYRAAVDRADAAQEALAAATRR